MTALCLWLTGGAVLLSVLIVWAVAREVMRAGQLAGLEDDEADMTDASNVPHGPFVPVLHDPGDDPITGFFCLRWPDCGCPDGAVRSDCPGLRRRARR